MLIEPHRGGVEVVTDVIGRDRRTVHEVRLRLVSCAIIRLN